MSNGQRAGRWAAVGMLIFLVGTAGSYRAGSVLLAAEGSIAAEGVSIDADFPGGNVQVERIVGDEVYLHQDLRDTVTADSARAFGKDLARAIKMYLSAQGAGAGVP